MAGADRRILSRLFSLYPPFLGAGIRVRRLPEGQQGFAVRMRLTFWNRNLVGTQFGGSLYSMCDPFFMIILIEALGPGYVVWDKAATIRFRRPGRGTVSAMFSIAAPRIEEIRAQADQGQRVEPAFSVEVRDQEGEVVAEVEKLLYVRKEQIKRRNAGDQDNRRNAGDQNERRNAGEQNNRREADEQNERRDPGEQRVQEPASQRDDQSRPPSGPNEGGP